MIRKKEKRKIKEGPDQDQVLVERVNNPKEREAKAIKRNIRNVSDILY